MKRILTTAFTLLLLAGCGGSEGYPRFSNAGASVAEEQGIPPQHPADPEAGQTESGLPPQKYRAEELQARNPNVVGWLYLPDTGIDEVIMYHPSDNDYYLNRGINEAYSNGGLMYADFRSVFGSGTRGELARNTVIYGKRALAGDWQGQLTELGRYLDPVFAAEHPYLYFSTTAEDMAWEVFAVCFVHVEVPYNRWDIPDEDYVHMLETMCAASVYQWDGTLAPEERILTLSTSLTNAEARGLTGDSSYYRFAVMARLVPPGEATKTQAGLTPRPGPTPVALPDWIVQGDYGYQMDLGDQSEALGGE